MNPVEDLIGGNRPNEINNTTPIRDQAPSSSVRTPRHTEDSWDTIDQGPLPKAVTTAGEGEEDDMNSNASSLGVCFGHVSDSRLHGQSHLLNKFGMRAASGSGLQNEDCYVVDDDDNVFAWDQPRAGGVRTPALTSIINTSANSTFNGRASSDAGGSRRHSGVENLPLHRQRSVQLWSREEMTGADAFAPEALSAQTYLQSRVHPASVARHRPSGSDGSRSHGTRSPQLWRGETIEEAMSPCTGGAQHPPLTHAGRQGCESVYTAHSDFSSRRSSAAASQRQKTGTILTSSSRLADATRAAALPPSPPRRGEDYTTLPVMSLPSARALSSSSSVAMEAQRQQQRDMGITKRYLAGKIEDLEAKMQHMEKVLLQALEKFDTRFTIMEQRLIEVQQRQLQQENNHLHLPSLGSRGDMSMPRVGTPDTREPSIAIDG